ncbi:MAG: hypothetical protein H6835_19965 [Planctomycetes bacterium]|nr:hypothetical protein [Planctomycetota bacterium]
MLPQVRERLWALVSTRLDRVESGLRLVLEGLDCSDGQLGLVDGLARDAMGGPVLVLLATEGDALLPARVLAAGSFVARVRDALVRAVPEARFCPGVSGRVLVVGTEASGAALTQVASLPVPALQVCALEPFRVAGSERFAVRWLAVGAQHASVDGAGVSMAPAAGLPASQEFVVPAQAVELWQRLCSICERISPGMQVHGDRFSRFITCNGALLGEVRTVDGGLLGSAATGVARELRDPRDVRWFGDQLLRAWARHAGLELDAEASNKESTSHDAGSGPVVARSTATRHAANGRDSSPAGESLRSSLEASRLSSDEYSALGAPPSSGGVGSEGAVAEDRQPSPSAKLTAPNVGRSD